MLNLAHACVTEEINGPGRRFTVWVQGCPGTCSGCFNPGLRPFEPRRHVAPADLAAEAAAAGPLDGVSLSGGEPFAQATPLAAFLDALRARLDGAALTALAFTGYDHPALTAGPAPWQELLARLDLLVAGPYLAAEAAALPLRSSANQRLVALTPAGEELKRRAEARGPGGFQVLVDARGEVLLTGFPPPGVAEKLRGALLG